MLPDHSMAIVPDNKLRLKFQLIYDGYQNQAHVVNEI